MDAEEELNLARNEAYRKIGRNILYLQGMEQKLKSLIALNGLQINSNGDNLEQRLADICKKTMGYLVGDFHESYFVNQGETSKKGVEPEETLFFSCKITGDDYSAHIGKTLASIVDDRNKLVHHFLQDLNDGIQGWEDANHRLEQQYDNLVAGHKNLKMFSDLIKEGILKCPIGEETLLANAVNDKEPEELS